MNVDGMIRLVGAVVRQAVLDGAPNRLRGEVSVRDQREAQRFVREALSHQPKKLQEIELWWRNPHLPCPVRGKE
jgi:hypothetical protein